VISMENETGQLPVKFSNATCHTNLFSDFSSCYMCVDTCNGVPMIFFFFFGGGGGLHTEFFRWVLNKEFVFLLGGGYTGNFSGVLH
jgi:hypothetical protein